MSRDTKKTSKISYSLIALAVFGVLLGSFIPLYAKASLINDDFEDYVLNTSPHGINGWNCLTGGVSCEIVDTQKKSGLQSLWISSTAGNIQNNFIGGQTLAGTISFYVYFPNTTIGGNFLVYNALTNASWYFVFVKSGSEIQVDYFLGGWNNLTTISLDAWHFIEIDFDNSTGNGSIQIDGFNSENITSLQSGYNISYFRFEGQDFYVDDFGASGLPATPSVFGVSPNSETEITDLDTNIIVGYDELDRYENLYITFTHPPTGLFADVKKYQISEIGGSGELEINFQDFNIEKNGNWYLHAVANRQGYQIEQEVFLSGYGWIWSDDLTTGDYYLNVNIDGFEGFFSMSDFTSWYSENSKFDEPTAMFSAIAGFFQPIYSTVGEFGSRIENYFDKNTAYSKGYEIGKILPVFSYYLEKVSVFMGGFPLMNWLLIIILILVGIFIFRVILKFIPFLGGS